jgi:hypothetical protein
MIDIAQQVNHRFPDWKVTQTGGAVMDEIDPTDSLRAVAQARARLAHRARWSLARHASFGVLMGSMVAATALPPGGVLAVVAACAVAAVLIVARDRQRDGMFISGYHKGKTRVLTALLLVMTLLTLVVAKMLHTWMGLTWAPLLLGVLTLFGCTAGSMMWERLYRQQLEDNDQ